MIAGFLHGVGDFLVVSGLLSGVIRDWLSVSLGITGSSILLRNLLLDVGAPAGDVFLHHGSSQVFLGRK